MTPVGENAKMPMLHERKDLKKEMFISVRLTVRVRQ